MKGGSVASQSVTSLVTPATYNALSKSFTNSTPSGLCGGGKKRKGKKEPTPKKKTPPQKGGNIWNRVMNDFAQHFTEGFTIRSEPAPVDYIYQESPQKGGVSFEGKKLHEYMTPNASFSIYNKKGGNCNNPSGSIRSVGLDYSGIKSTGFDGAQMSRSMSPSTLYALTDSSVSGSAISSMNKAVNFGSLGAAGTSVPFSYGGITGGAKVRRSAKAKAKATATAKSKPKPATKTKTKPKKENRK